MPVVRGGADALDAEGLMMTLDAVQERLRAIRDEKIKLRRHNVAKPSGWRQRIKDLDDEARRLRQELRALVGTGLSSET